MSPLRDVAGLLRSIDYAAATMLDPKNVVANSVTPGRRQRLVTRLREGAERDFLGAYRETASGLPGMDGGDLLDFFLIEKAAYEVSYEAANRPSWLGIPVSDAPDLRLRHAVGVPAPGPQSDVAGANRG